MLRALGWGEFSIAGGLGCDGWVNANRPPLDPSTMLRASRTTTGEGNHEGFAPTGEDDWLEGQGEVVYEASVTDLDGEESEGAVLGCGEGLEGVGVDDGCIVESGEGFGGDDADHFGPDVGAGAYAFVAEFLGTGEGFPEDGGCLSLVGVEVDIAATDGQAVGFADRGDTDDFKREIQVTGHAPDDD